MLLIQMTGLSGAGKSSIATIVSSTLSSLGHKVQLLDGDECRRELCNDLGFSKEHRLENIRRLGYVGLLLAQHGVICIMSVINPYEEAREALKNKNSLVKTVFIHCPLSVTKQRDPKGLYSRAHLPAGHPDHIKHFTGVSDPYETPVHPDLTIHTDIETPTQSARRLTDFILESIGQHAHNRYHNGTVYM